MRLIEFGPFANKDRYAQSQGKRAGEVDNFTFLGFSHYCGISSRGHFAVWRRTARRRLKAKLQAVK
jgi:RNA-directed DNA polymerase